MVKNGLVREVGYYKVVYHRIFSLDIIGVHHSRKLETEC